MRYDEIVDTGLQILRDAGIGHWMNLGAETQSQNRLNRQYMDALTFEMRFLGDGKWADTETKLFGMDLPAPIMPAALTASRVINKLAMWEEPWLESVASGVADAGSIMWVGMSTSYELQRIIDQGAPVVKIVKPLQDNDSVLHRIRDAEARGVVTGLTRGATAGHLARAALEGIAYQVADVLDAMRKDAAIDLPQLRVDGGAAANDLLLQFQADLLRVPVERPTVLETTALGAAYFAGLGSGAWGEGLERTVDRTFEPRMDASEAGRLRARWSEAVNRARDWEEKA